MLVDPVARGDEEPLGVAQAMAWAWGGGGRNMLLRPLFPTFFQTAWESGQEFLDQNFIDVAPIQFGVLFGCPNDGETLTDVGLESRWIVRANERENLLIASGAGGCKGLAK